MEQPLPSDFVPRGAEPWRLPDTAPQRPLDLLVTGGLLAGGAMLGVLAIVYKAWYSQELAGDTATLLCGFLFFVYAGGVYIFCYAWERGDVARAIRLTLIVVLLSAVAVLVAAIVFAILARTKGGSGGGSTAIGSSTTAVGDGIARNLGGLLRVAGSYVEDDEVRTRANEEQAPESEILTVPCERCGTRFMPIPPRALCPQCGQPAVTVA